jgi:hypothetical protein
LLEANEKEVWKRSGGKSVSVYGITPSMFDRAAKAFLFFLGFLAIGISFSKSDLRTKVVVCGLMFLNYDRGAAGVGLERWREIFVRGNTKIIL